MKTSAKIVLVPIGIGLAVVAVVALVGIAITVDGQYQRPSRMAIMWMCLAAMNAVAIIAWGLFAASAARFGPRPESDSPR